MMELSLEKLLGFLQEIVPGEISEKSLCYLLHIKSHTAKRLLNGEIKRPDEVTWYINARRMAEEVDNAYEDERQTVLKGRPKEKLTPTEKKNLKKVEEEFVEKLEEKYKDVGIFDLQGCCHFPTFPLDLIFNKQLTSLVGEVLRISEQFQGIKGKELLLNFLRQNNGSPSDIDEVERMNDYEYNNMAKFLVAKVSQNQNKADNRGHENAEDMKSLESSANLLDRCWNPVGICSYLIFTEKQEKLFQNGTLFENAHPELAFLPGDYILYVLDISAPDNNRLTRPQDFQELVDALFRKLRFYATRRDGIYFKKLCINISDPIYECLYRNIGFQFTVEDFLSGHIYVQPLIPFPSSLKTKEPSLLSELKEIYDEHFGA